MFHIFVMLQVKEDHQIDDVKRCLEEIAYITLRDEDGCRKLDVLHSQSDPSVFFLDEEWASKKAWEDHRNKKAYSEIYAPMVLPLVNRIPHVVEKISSN